ncbi:MAG: polysaccharide biosynthesis/export family protein [Hyphomicrobiaceae bacterium]
MTAAALLVLALAGCSGQPATIASGLSNDQAAALERVYRLGIGDKLRVEVFDEKDLSGDVEVGADGNVTMPLVGPMPAKGKTPDEFAALLVARLERGYLKSPKVGVQILNQRPIYVHGEVRNGGEFGYKPGLTVADAVAMAGGYSYRAEQGYVLLRREGWNGEKAIANDGALAVLPGDNIRIPERFF